MAYFNFTRLIDKYTSEFTLITQSEGYYDDSGKWVKGETTKTVLRGAIIGFRESKVFRAEGTLTANDKHLFLTQPIDRALLGATVIYQDKKYNVEAVTENAQFTGVYSYVLKYVSAFDKAVKTDD